MKWTISLLCVLILGVCVAPAQVSVQPGGARPMEKPADPSTYHGVRLLKYLQGQLNLSKEQSEQYSALIEKYKDGRKQLAGAGAPVTESQTKLQTELNEALKAKDQARIQKAREGLDALVPDKPLMDQFFADLDKLLDDSQKAALTKVRQSLKDGKALDLRIKPREAVRIIESLGLTPEQSAKVAKLEDELRAKISPLNPADEDGRQALVTQFVSDLKSVLSPAQSPKFDQAMKDWTKAASEGSAKPAGDGNK